MRLISTAMLSPSLVVAALMLLAVPGCDTRSPKSSTSMTTGSSGSSGTGAGETDCLSAFDAASCAALGDHCFFLPLDEFFQWNGGPSCIRNDAPGFGWCLQSESGGNGAPQAYWEPESGRVASLPSKYFSEIPKGWEECIGVPGQPPCCKCLSSGAPPECEQNDSIGSSGGGTSTGTGTGG